MAVRPELGKDTSDKVGSGTLEKSYDYLKYSDPNEYNYQRLKDEGNPFLRDDMWTEASKRGELNELIYLLDERNKYEPGKSYAEYGKTGDSTEVTMQELDAAGVDALSRLDDYEGFMTYDAYMTALSIPTLDNETKVERIDEETGYKYGDYTDREWALEVLNSQLQRYDAQIVEEWKENNKFLAGLATAGAAFGEFLSGADKFINDIFNIGEGLLNMAFNWSGDESIGDRFLYAFSNDEVSEFDKALFEFERNYTFSVDAEQAYLEGYTPGSDIVDVGVTTVGTWVNGITESIGYMLPSILLTQGLGLAAGAGAGAKVGTTTIKAIGTGTFYAGIFSGNVKDTVQQAALNGISYKDLNAGEVVGNAAIKATAQLVIEKALGKITSKLFGTESVLNRLLGTAGKSSAKTITNIASKGALTTALKRGAIGAVQEGLEEFFQDLSDGLIDVAFGQFGTNLNEIYTSRGQETISLENLVQSFTMGALTSVIVGGITNLKYLGKRGLAVDANGKVYKMGVFQTMNYVDALRTMNDWNNTLNDPKASKEAIADAAFKMSIAMNTLGSVMKTMGQENAFKANDLLVGYLNGKAKDKISKALSIGDRAKNLYNTFNDYNKKITAKYQVQILQAAKEKAEKLKKGKVTKFNNAVTSDIDVNDKDNALPKNTLEKLKSVMNGLGSEVLIGTDGDIITKSGKVVFVPDKILQDSNVAAIIQGIAYDQVNDEVIKALTPTQRNFIAVQYQKLMGRNVTLSEAVTTLLFDKEFYTKMLLLSSEGTHKFKNKAIDILTTLHAVVKRKANAHLENGTITTRAYNALLNKVMNTLRTGIISYATKYVDFDVDKLDNELFPKELKDAVKNHRNVIFTNNVKQGLDTTKTLSLSSLQWFDNEIDKLAQDFNYKVLSKEDAEQLKKDVRTPSKRKQAYLTLQVGAKLRSIVSDEYDANKTIMLADVADGEKLVRDEYVKELETIFGATIADMASGNFNPNNLSDEIKNLIINTTDEIGNQLYRLDTREDRLYCLQQLMFQISKGNYTIDSNFNVTQIISKSQFLDKKYLAEDGEIKLQEGLANGSIKKISDIISKDSNIPSYLKDVEIRYTPELQGGSYTDGDSFIVIGKPNNDNYSSEIMHELTHVAQYQIRKSNPDLDITGGGSYSLFNTMTKETAKDLSAYIYNNYPIVYSMLKNFNSKNSFINTVYYLLEGELQANSSLNTIFSFAGFKLRDNKTTLVSPDGKKTWSLIGGKANKKAAQLITKVVEAKKTETKKTEAKKTEAKKTTKSTSVKLVSDLSKLQNDLKKKYNVNPVSTKNQFLKLFNTTEAKLNSLSAINRLIKEVNQIEATKATKTLLNFGKDYLQGLKQIYTSIAKEINDSIKSKDEVLKSDNNLLDQKDVKEHMKDAYFVKGNSIIPFYRVSSNAERKALGSKYYTDKYMNNSDNLNNKGVIMLSTEPLISFSENIRNPSMSAYAVNLKANEILRINGNNKTWNNLLINENALLNHKELANWFKNMDKLTTDELIEIILDYKKDYPAFKNIKAIYISDIYEGGNGSQLTNDLVILGDTSSLMKVSSEDNGQFFKDYATYILSNSLYENRENTNILKSFMENYTPSQDVILDKLPEGYDLIKRSKAVIAEENRRLNSVRDMPLDYEGAKNVMKEESNREHMYKDGRKPMFMKDGVPVIFYRGSGLKRGALNEEGRVSFMSTKPFVSEFYADKGRVVNAITKNLFNSIKNKDKAAYNEVKSKFLKATPDSDVEKVTEGFKEIDKLYDEITASTASFVTNFGKQSILFGKLAKLLDIVTEDVYRGYICNLTENEVFTYDAKGNFWSDLYYNSGRYDNMTLSELRELAKKMASDPATEYKFELSASKIDTMSSMELTKRLDTYTTDDLAKLIQKRYPNIKALLITNVDEGQDETQGFGNDLIVFDPSSLKRVTLEDNGKFINVWREIDSAVHDSVINGDNEATVDNAELGEFIVENYMESDGVYNRELLFNDFVERYIEYTNKIARANQTNMDEILKTDKDIAIKNDAKNKDYAKAIGARYISNSRASKSNLKYWIQKGKPILMHPGVADFVEGTTENFDKLSKHIKDKITKHTLTKSDLTTYFATAIDINDYTYQAIVKYLFKNDIAAKLTVKEMTDLLDRVSQFATVSHIMHNTKDSENDITRTPKELVDFVKTTLAGFGNSKGTKSLLTRASDAANSVKVISKNGNIQRVQVDIDPSMLRLIFARTYDGTLRSLYHINNYAKVLANKSSELEADIETLDTISSKGASKSQAGKYNWVDRLQKVDTIYDNDTEIQDTVGEVNREVKVKAVQDYYTEQLRAKIGNRTLSVNEQLQIATRLQEQLDKIEDMSDVALDKRYLAIMTKEVEGKPSAKEATQILVEERPNETSKKLLKDPIRNLGRRITRQILGMDKRSSRFKANKAIIEKYFDPKTFKLKSDYQSKSIDELNEIKNTLTKLSENLKAPTEADIEKMVKAKTDKLAKSKQANITREQAIKRTLKEKVQVVYKTKIVNQKITGESTVKLSKTGDTLVKNILNTNWEKYNESEVKGVEFNDVKSVSSYVDFLNHNLEALMAADALTIEEAARWFLDFKGEMNEADFRQFLIVKTYFLEAINSYPSIFENISPNLKQRIDKWISTTISTDATLLAVHNNVLKVKDPLKYLKAEEMIIDNVVISDKYKDILFSAIESNDLTKITEAWREIYQFVQENKSSKKSFLRKLTSTRSMMMLSSPMTWLRNKVSNLVLKRLNKFASAIGNRVFKNKTQQGQIKLTGKVTPEIQQFIEKNFIDNKFFDTIVSNISKYNPSDITEFGRSMDQIPSKEAVMTNLVIKAMYGQYYNENMFKSKFMNSAYKYLMKAMSDDSYVREAAVRYFGKIIAEKGYDLSTGKVTDEIMNDLATSIGLAMNDYMHSDNFFNSLEKNLMNRSEVGWFVYKLIMPYASSSWNWFKAMIKMTPMGLAKSIVDLYRLEKNITKNERLWREGKTQINPELREYMIRRDIGMGVMGTIGYILGAALAALGFIRLEDDDYGNPKIRIGNLVVDISSIFGSSSILAGGALITGFKDGDGFSDAMNRMLDVALDNFPVMDIVELDMYSNGTWDIFGSTAESVALSFIPNLFSWLAGATYSGTVKKDTLWKRALAKIPFMANFLDKVVDPYTGETGSYMDAINRIVPYFSWIVASENQSKTEELGLNKSQLRGSYNINGEDFNVRNSDLQKINEYYGKWNANDLTKFYDNQMRVKVKVGNTYKTLTYNQMTNEQRQNAVQNIMSNNAELAKILAWTLAGHKYYGTSTTYATLKKYGITKNVYVGSKGFVK